MPKGAPYERANILYKKSNIHKDLKHSACLHMQPKLFLVPSSLFLAAPKNPHHHHRVFFLNVSTRRNKNGNENICTSISWAIGFHIKNCNFFVSFFFVLTAAKPSTTRCTFRFSFLLFFRPIRTLYRTHISRLFAHFLSFCLSSNWNIILHLEPWVINCPFTRDLSPLTIDASPCRFMQAHCSNTSRNWIQISNQLSHLHSLRPPIKPT